jgi:hypothetical protein
MGGGGRAPKNVIKRFIKIERLKSLLPSSYITAFNILLAKNYAKTTARISSIVK